MAENKGYEYVTYDDPRIGNVPERIKNRKIRHTGVGKDSHYPFRDELYIFNRYFLLQNSTIFNKHDIYDLEYLVINTYIDDTTDPVETLKSYIDDQVDYDNYLYQHRNCPKSQACLNSEKPKSPDTPSVIIVNVEDWMKNHIDDDLIQKIRIAYQKELLHEKLFKNKMLNILLERKENVIDSIFS